MFSSAAPAHTVATYNMSFASDLDVPIKKLQWPSEATFLARLVDADPAIRRSYWTNALKLLQTFLEEKKPVAVGLQEINLVEVGTNTGTDAINQMLTRVNSEKDTSYKQISRNVPIPNTTSFAGVSIVFDLIVLGAEKHVTCIDNPNQGGRPILMVITEKNYLLISVHGAQDPKLREDKTAFNDYMVANNTNTIQEKATQFLTDNYVTPVGIYVMGDLNDRYDAIQEITIGGKKISYYGTAPKSCCYNWDSSCPDDRAKDLVDGYKTCNVPVDEIVKPGNIKASMGEEGATVNYRYAGDKVFGLDPVKEVMKIYRPGAESISTESDHELVYATFNPVAVGGYRKNSRKHRKSHRKSKKARQNKRRATRRRA